MCMLLQVDKTGKANNQIYGNNMIVLCTNQLIDCSFSKDKH